MNWDWIIGGALLALTLLALTALWAARRDRTRIRAELEEARRDSAELALRVDDLIATVDAATEASRSGSVPGLGEGEDAGYPITTLGRSALDRSTPEPVSAVPVRIEGRLFVDIVARETVVRAASFGHGLRRALTPEARNRIRFEMRRELKRARKQRRADIKAARRDWQARQRAGIRQTDLREDGAA